ncbi:Putative zn(2)Cys(6) fungal-type DNA-binding domain, fungal transcription factor [Colletotrichum destructivum]|uniref:Zn(2)Cys(6) fungal-type DNA-binding domain, fungal transcription factor n=1 Tax=Colletotrichum destructivum TaxID=34406 RepID=A0AAX4I1U4_9PEZI|nr:Putative zn(2)Cys(6) fungal-type DNA-binding domain, fungal transcription factor [Colletotrichum destructivum]
MDHHHGGGPLDLASSKAAGGGPWILPKPMEVVASPEGEEAAAVTSVTAAAARRERERSSPTTEETSKRRRAGGPKARTGCATCKTRHVKCDERKPTCFRCEKVGVACEGYVERVDRRRRRQTQNVVRRTTPLLIAPRSRSTPSEEEAKQTDECSSEQHAVVAVVAPSPQTTQTRTQTKTPYPTQTQTQTQTHTQVQIHAQVHAQIPRSVSILPEIYRKDGIYFDYFRHQVSTNLAGYYTSPNWSYLVVGEGLQDDCIHHSILAVGALIRASPQEDANNPGGGLPPPRKKLLTDGYGVTAHREVALRHHVKAVKSLRERMELITASSPTTVVVTTLLLVVYELLQGEPKTAELLLNSCLGVLKDCITMFESGGGGGSGAVETTTTRQHPRDSEFDDMEHVLPCIAAMSHLSQSLQPLRRHTHPFRIDPGPDLHDPEHDSISRFFISWGRFFTFGVGFVGNSADFASTEGGGGVGGDITTLDALRHRLTTHQQTLLARLRRWRAVIQYYAQSPRVDAGTKKGLRIVQIHWLLLHITLTCCLDPTEVAYDAFGAEFRDLTVQCVDLYRDCVSQPRPTSVLLGQGLILPLCTVVRACRDHDVRMTALQALREIPSSMVSWDVVSAMDGILGALLLEETGRRADGFVPPESRWFWLEDVPVAQETGTGTGPAHSSRLKVYQRLSPDYNGKAVLTKLRTTSDMQSRICKTAGCNKEHVLDSVVVEDL